MTDIFSANKDWYAISEPAPLRMVLPVKRCGHTQLGWCYFSKVGQHIELVGGVWSEPPDQRLYSDNVLLGHTGRKWMGDEIECQVAKRNQTQPKQ